MKTSVRLGSMFLLATPLLACLATSSDCVGQNAGKTPDPKYVEGEDHLKKKAKWEWVLHGPTGKEIDKGTFMGYVDGRIMHGTDQKEVGTWKSTGKGTVAVTFSWPRLKGNWEFQMVNAQPPTYSAVQKATTKKGKAAPEKLIVKILND